MNIDNGIKIKGYKLMIPILIISLTVSFSTHSKNHQLSYLSKLHQYLISDSDINAQLFGLLIYEFFDVAEAKPVLHKAINENSSKYTIYLADEDESGLSSGRNLYVLELKK